MATVYCKSHPGVPARWTCTQCHVDLCAACVRPGKAFTPCPVCEGTMEAVGMSNAITPFWLRIPKVFLYPAHRSALTYIAVLAVLSALLGTSGGLVLGLLQLVIFIVFVRYGYAALESSAQGHLNPPRVDGELVGGDLSLPFKQLVVFFIMLVATLTAFKLLGGFAGGIVLILAYASLPASAMVLATSHSLRSAVSPGYLFETIRCIGWPYAVLWLFLGMLSAGSAALRYALSGVGESFLGVTLYQFVNMYFLLAMFHLMGYVIYQYHQVLDYPVEVDFDDTSESGAARLERGTDPVHAQVGLLVQQGKAEAATKLLREKISAEPGDLELRAKLHKLLMLAGDAKALSDAAPPYIALLMAGQKARQAAEIVRDCLGLDQAFRPAEPDWIFPLVEQLRNLREPKLAVKLAHNFHQRHGNHADLPKVYFLISQILCEELKQDRQAAKILAYLQSRFPQHQLAPQIRDYRMLVERLALDG